MYLAINWGIADFLLIWHWETYFILIKNLKKNHFKNVVCKMSKSDWINQVNILLFLALKELMLLI